MDSLIITRPDDWHLHVRDGEALGDTVNATAEVFQRAIIMPNLLPPVTRLADALAYRDRIQEAARPELAFQPLMTLYLTDRTRVEDIDEAADSGQVLACKLYPAGATTNSDSGVTDLAALEPVLARMAERGLLLLVHGEVVTAEVDIFDREQRFIDDILIPLRERLPTLKIVLEHITTANAVQFVLNAGDNTGATITAHHLLCNRNDMLVGGIRPHYFCLPILKRSSHQQALQDVVASGHERFFLGTDSAPHPTDRKESACGCAGCYTAPMALPIYAQVFDELGALDKLEGFASHYGPDFYGLPRNSDTVRLIRKPLDIPAQMQLGSQAITPFLAGEQLPWQIDQSYSDGKARGQQSHDSEERAS